LLGVTPCRVRVLIREGRIKAAKIGRDWVVDESSLKAVMNRPHGVHLKVTPQIITIDTSGDETISFARRRIGEYTKIFVEK